MSALEQAIARADTDWQRAVLREWGRRNSKPLKIGRLGWEWVPTPCTCVRCGTPAVIIPDASIVPERGYCICPRCCAPKELRA